MTIQDVANLLKVSWDTIKEMEKRYLNKKFSKPDLKKLQNIAIDEIYLGIKVGYLTVVMDLKPGAVVFVGTGKVGDALLPFWKRLKRIKTKIKAVAMDLGKAYIKAVTDNLPNAEIVFDHFHVIKLYNEKLTKLRRDLQREAEEKLDKNVLKGTRWLLLKSADKLDEEKDEKSRLQEALDLNKPLSAAYYMKDDLGQIWKQKDKSSATELLNDWVKRAQASGIQMLIKFSKTLASHRTGILSYYDFDKMSSGPMEGTNNKIKTLQKMAYGYRDMEFFKLKILGLHETKYSLIG
jgi:transposase